MLVLLTLESRSDPDRVIHEVELKEMPRKGDVLKLSETDPFRFKVPGVTPETPTVFFNGRYVVTKIGEEREHPENRSLTCSIHSGAYPHIEVRRSGSLDHMNQGETPHCILNNPQDVA